jgi:hypothetical protein
MERAEWLELVALMRALWPQGDLPESTTETWYATHARRWSQPITQAAISDLAGVSTHLPSLAELIEARDAASRAQPALPEGTDAPVEVGDIRGWLRVIRAMTQEERDGPLRTEVRRRISDHLEIPDRIREAGGRTYEERLQDGRWVEVAPLFESDADAVACLDALSRLVEAPEAPTPRRVLGGAERRAQAGQPPVRVPGFSTVGEGLADALGAWE